MPGATQVDLLERLLEKNADLEEQQRVFVFGAEAGDLRQRPSGQSFFTEKAQQQQQQLKDTSTLGNGSQP